MLTLASVAYFRLKRFRYRWMFIGMFTIALGFSILLAAHAGLGSASTRIGVIGGAIIGAIVGRLSGCEGGGSSSVNRRIAEGAREIGEQLQSEGLFRDDGERITVHVDRSKLLRRILTQIVRALIVCGRFYLGALKRSG